MLKLLMILTARVQTRLWGKLTGAEKIWFCNMFQPQHNWGWAVLYPVRRQRRVDAGAEADQWRGRICTNLIHLDDLREGDIIWWSITSRPKKLKLKHCLHSFYSVWSHYDSCKPCLINKVQNITKREESFVMSCPHDFFVLNFKFRFDLCILFSVHVLC